MLKRIVAVSMVAVSGWACSGGGAARIEPAEPPPPAAPELAQLQPGTHAYLLVSRRSVQRVLEGQPMADTSWVRVRATLDIDPDYGFRVHVDSVLSARPAPSDTMTGSLFSGRTSPEGGVTDFSGPDDESPVVQAIRDLWREFLPRLPVGGVAPGATWSDSLADARSQSGADMQVSGDTRYRAGEWASHDGLQALLVSWEGDYTVSGTGEQFGQPFNIVGDGRETGSLLISSTGVVLSRTSSSEMRGEITIPTMGIAFPIAQIQVDSARVQTP